MDETVELARSLLVWGGSLISHLRTETITIWLVRDRVEQSSSSYCNVAMPESAFQTCNAYTGI